MKDMMKLLIGKYKAIGIIAILLPFIYYFFEKIWGKYEILSNLIYGISASLFSSLFILVSFNKELVDLINSMNSEFERHIETIKNELIPFRDQIIQTGLIGIVNTNNMKSLNIDIVNSSKLIIAMNDGKNFLSNNSTELSERYSDKSKKTIIILFDPEAECENVLCRQNGKDVGVYATKIKDVIKDLKRKKENSADIEIYVTDVMLRTHTVITDNIAVSGTYRNSQGKDNIPPSYIYSNQGKEYNFILNDIEKIKNSAKKV
ncbi:hypothetical protein AM305_00509 [Actinobacillus minor NM305]|uniref:Uncharacterized protein n=2 Tax=Actinobacillus minor TaxID=51047 RepID=C5S3P4_9PAST|nr:hypothetical protein [Actinobacillus minor]EER46492.1 hypothetical protein AM305_00509 [Actinobacillus minor NM305]